MGIGFVFGGCCVGKWEKEKHTEKRIKKQVDRNTWEQISIKMIKIC